VHGFASVHRLQAQQAYNSHLFEPALAGRAVICVRKNQSVAGQEKPSDHGIKRKIKGEKYG